MTYSEWITDTTIDAGCAWSLKVSNRALTQRDAAASDARLCRARKAFLADYSDSAFLIQGHLRK